MRIGSRRVAVAAGCCGIVVGLVGSAAASVREGRAAKAPAPVAFEVAGPPVLVIGGIPDRRPTCRPRQVTGKALLRPSPDGVLGVVKLSSAAKCNVRLAGTAPSVLDAKGRRLAVPVESNLDTNNPATNNNWAVERTASEGFAWDGSWCGRQPVRLRVALPRGSVVTRLSGSPPACSETTGSRLIVGVTGLAGQPTEAAPPEWRYLSAQLEIGGIAGVGPALHAMSVTFTNSSSQAVELIPARYCIGAHDKYGDGTDCEASRVLTKHDRTIPADGALTLPVPDQSLSEDYRDLRGRRITVAFAMAGVPTATTTVAKTP